MNTDGIAVHQTLHGYGDGHRLLSGSLQLPSEDARTMLVLSDLSGPSLKPGQYGYLTGYPLESSGKYVLARSWLAPEMPRPGCVWTHSLIIDFADLASLQSAMPLIEQFRRPSGLPGPADYEERRRVQIRQHAFSSLPPWVRGAKILGALYSEPTRKIVAKVSDPVSDEAMLLAMWMQQWPRLRRTFRFCSLAGTDRSTKSDMFDLQLVKSSDRLSLSRFPNALDADDARPVPDLAPLLEDLPHSGETKLRSFLRRVGGDVAGGRSAMAPLCRLYSSLGYGADHDLVAAIEILEELGPSQARVARSMTFKRALLNVGDLDDRHFQLVLEKVASDESLLKEATASGDLGRILWKRAPRQFASSLTEGGAIARIAEIALPLLSTNDVLSGLEHAPELATQMASAIPSLMTEPDFWLLPGTNSLVGRLEIPDDETVPVIVALIVAGRTGSARDVAAIFGPRNVLRAIGQAAEETGERAVVPWCEAVSRYKSDIATALAAGEVASRVALVALARSLESEDVPNDYGEDPWFTAVRTATGSVGHQAEDFFASFLLSRGLSWRSGSAAGLIRMCFGRVHEALAEGRLDQRTTSLVSKHFGWSSWEWDQCARLREVVVNKFVNDKLDPESFGRLTGDGLLWERLAKLAAKSGRGRRYLADVGASIRHAAERTIRTRADYIDTLIE